jgi:hypothetical protein
MRATLKTLLSTGLLLAATAPAWAVTTLTLENPGSVSYQQTQNSPCVIGDSSCNNPTGFDQTTIPTGPTGANYDLFSPTYTVGQINTAIGGSTFLIGIDVNSTTQPVATEILNAFNVFVNGTLQYSFSTPTQLDDPNQGNGFSDELLLAIPNGINLTSFGLGASVQFEASISNATDGREEFFLVNTNAPVNTPEPGSLFVLGVGLAGVGMIRRKFQKS